MSDTNDQYDLRSLANEHGDVRSVANEQAGLSNANNQSDQSAVLGVQHGRYDQSGRTYLKLVHSRSGHKTCISMHRDQINVIGLTYTVTELAGLPITLAVIRDTLSSISEKDRLIEEAVPDKLRQAELETIVSSERRYETSLSRRMISWKIGKRLPEDRQEKRTGFIQFSHQDQVRSSCRLSVGVYLVDEVYGPVRFGST